MEQQPIHAYTETGGLQLLWRVLDKAFRESDAENFLREWARRECSRVDPESKISDMAWGQRLLQRASLSRRERHDVFYAAGAGFQSSAIEKALRIRCGRIHEDEKKGHFRSYDDESTAYKPKNQHFYKKKIITKKVHGAHVAAEEDVKSLMRKEKELMKS